MIELFLVKPTGMIEIPTQSITWSGKRFNAARKINVKLLYRRGIGREIVKVEEGDTVLFRWKGTELFRGTVFNRSMNRTGVLSMTAYDMLQYLLLNKNIYLFTNVRADQIASRILKDYEIPFDSLTNTGYVLKAQLFESETTLYDMILKGLVETEKQTNRAYRLSSKEGKVRLDLINAPNSMWMLETGVNIKDYAYSTSMEGTATKVKLVAGEEKKQITATITDAAGAAKLGILQHFEKVSGEINQAQLNERARMILTNKKGVKKVLSIDALGVPELVSGMPVRVIERDIPIDKVYYVESDTHTFQGNSHSMSLNLIEHHNMPEVKS